jgi:hypothetical protein
MQGERSTLVLSTVNTVLFIGNTIQLYSAQRK